MKPFVLQTFEAAAPQPILAGDGWASVARALRAGLVEGSAAFDPLLQAVVECAADSIPGAAVAWVEMRSRDALLLRAASRSAARAELPVGDALSRRAIAARRPLRCTDLPADQRSASRSLSWFLAIPFPHAGEIAGLLKLGSAAPAPFGPPSVDLACLLAAPIAFALAGASRPDSGTALAAGFHQAAVGMAHLGDGGQMLLVNDRLAEIAGRSRQALANARFADLVHGEERATIGGLLASLFADALGSFDTELRLLRPDQREIWVAVRASLVRDARGKPDFVAAIVEDVDIRKQAELAAAHDPLTGLLNPRGLQERLERELDRSANDGRPLTVALVAVDGLPLVNETLGAAEGERCLQRVAAALRSACRPGDAAGRVGGDSFILLLPGLDTAGAAKFLDRPREAIARLGKQAKWPISSRIGTASRPRDGATAASLIAAAAGRLDE